jgi:hypothetical protein
MEWIKGNDKRHYENFDAELTVDGTSIHVRIYCDLLRKAVNNLSFD